MKYKPKGLHKLPAKLLIQAQDETTATISRTVAMLVGIAVFCLLALLAPDISLLTDGRKLNIPLAGPVSFVGFMVVGPAVLIAIRVYLQIYVEHWRRLESIRSRVAQPRAPTLAPMQNSLLQIFIGIVVYLLVPLTLAAFTWKALVFRVIGTALLLVSIGSITLHLLLLFRWSWWRRVMLSAIVAGIGGLLSVYVDLERPFNLDWANLSNQYLPGTNLRGAFLRRANLMNASLEGTRLEGAILVDANLESANLRYAYLEGADLRRAILRKAHISNAFLGWANLEGANLEGANLARADVHGANLGSASLAGTDFRGADLGGASLAGADLRGANLENAYLQGAFLLDAQLEGADLGGAHLGGADLRGAHLEGAKLHNADLEQASLLQLQLNVACGNEETRLSADLIIPRCPAE